MTLLQRDDDVWREHTPYVIAALVRRFGDFEAAEDAAQEALLAASAQWATEGTPDDPTAWLLRVASRRMIDEIRSDSARVDRERRAVALSGPVPAGPGDHAVGRDDSLSVLLMCCPPRLTPASQVALTLSAVGGLTTAQVAKAFLVPETTMAQRISRAKARLRGVSLSAVTPAEMPGRLRAVMHVLYLIFNEGHTASTGPALCDGSLTHEAVRLTRQLRRALPGDCEVAGLLALMLLTDARRPARAGPGGMLVPLAEQERSLWDMTKIDEGTALLEEALPHGPVGSYQLEAAIAAVHDEAPTWQETDWPQIVELYRMLDSRAALPERASSRSVGLGFGHITRAGTIGRPSQRFLEESFP